jgi:hypothetical protein
LFFHNWLIDAIGWGGQIVGGISHSIYYWLIRAIQFLSAFLGAVYMLAYFAGWSFLITGFTGCYGVGLPVFFLFILFLIISMLN